jgi:hypothetical protein
MSKPGLALVVMFGFASLLLGQNGDGQILVAMLAWPSSIAFSIACESFQSLCEIPGLPFALVVCFGCAQYYFLGYLIQIIFVPKKVDAQ